MPAVIEAKKDFSSFMAQNREKAYAIANANTPKNKNGKAVITKDDPWRNEHEWDELSRRKQ